MSKSTKYPAYSGGGVNINGTNIASTSRSGNTVNSDYQMSNLQKKYYNALQSNMAGTLNNLFEISDPQQKEWQNQLNAMQEVGLQNINDIYTPIQNNLKNDIASRFGNLNNSIFMDNLSNITNSKSKAIADLTNSILLAQNDLYNQEIQNRLNVLSLLDSLNNSLNSNILSYLGLANSNANSGNQYNQAAYQAALQQQGNNTWGQLARLGGSALSTYFGGPAAGAAFSGITSSIR